MMWTKLAKRIWIHKAASLFLIFLASALFLLNLRRHGEKAGRAAERIRNLEQINHAQRDMLEAASDRPRNRDDLLDRLRKGGF